MSVDDDGTVGGWSGDRGRGEAGIGGDEGDEEAGILEGLASRIVGNVLGQVATFLAEHPEDASLRAVPLDDSERPATSDVHAMAEGIASRVVSNCLSQFNEHPEYRPPTGDPSMLLSAEVGDGDRPSTSAVRALSSDLAQSILDNSIANIQGRGGDVALSRPQTGAVEGRQKYSRPATGQLQGYSEGFIESVFRNAISHLVGGEGVIEYEKAKQVVTTIVDAWTMSDKWKYTIMPGENKEMTTVVKVMWAMPMRRRPVPTATAATFFMLTRLEDLVTVTWRLEEQALVHSATCKCREQWLHDVLARKRAVQEQISLDDLVS